MYIDGRRSPAVSATVELPLAACGISSRPPRGDTLFFTMITKVISIRTALRFHLFREKTFGLVGKLGRFLPVMLRSLVGGGSSRVAWPTSEMPSGKLGTLSFSLSKLLSTFLFFSVERACENSLKVLTGIYNGIRSEGVPLLPLELGSLIRLYRRRYYWSVGPIIAGSALVHILQGSTSKCES